ALKDLESVEKRLQKVQKDAKAGGKQGEQAKAEMAVLQRIAAGINEGQTVRRIPLTDEEKEMIRDLFLLTAKPVLYVANVAESQLGSVETDPLVAKARAVAERDNAPLVVICADVESQIQQLPAEERADFLASAGLSEPGLHK